MDEQRTSLRELRQRFLATLERERIKPGDTLWSEGDSGDDLLLVLRGRLVLTRRNEAGAEICLGVVGPGQVIGELAMLSPGPRTATAAALTEVRIARLDRRTLLERLVSQDPVARELLRACTEVVVHRLRRTRDLRRALDDYSDGASDGELDSALEPVLGAREVKVTDRLRGNRS